MVQIIILNIPIDINWAKYQEDGTGLMFNNSLGWRNASETNFVRRLNDFPNFLL
jgi:hypothetical protein